MIGKIVKGIAGFYYVHIPNEGVFECKARGLFRNQSIKPLIGDNVVVDSLENEHKKGNIVDILPRRNELVRPTVSNVDQALIVFSITQPEPNLNLLDRFLITVLKEGIDASICFNKCELVPLVEIEKLKRIYEKIGYPVLITSAKKQLGIDNLLEVLDNKTTVVAGPSGVGKSSLLNLVQTEIALQIGELSKKVERGKHTTRHAELICFGENSYVVDTPGFSSLSIEQLQHGELKEYYEEFGDYLGDCQYNSCNHIHELSCGVKKALSEGEISQIRYDNYIMLYNELKEIRRW